MLRDTCEKEGLTEVSLSIGCALTREGDTLDVLYIRADQALYQVKHSGRNGFQVEQ